MNSTAISTGLTSRAMHEFSKRAGNPLTPVVSAIVAAVCLAIVVFILNIIAVGFCVFYMFQGSRYYRRHVNLMDKQQKEEADLLNSEPMAEKSKRNKLSMIVTSRPKLFSTMSRNRTPDNHDIEDQPIATVASPTVALYRQALTPAIQEQEYPETRSEKDIFATSARSRISFWKRGSVSKFEPMDAVSLKGQAV